MIDWQLALQMIIVFQDIVISSRTALFTEGVSCQAPHSHAGVRWSITIPYVSLSWHNSLKGLAQAKIIKIGDFILASSAKTVFIFVLRIYQLG